MSTVIGGLLLPKIAPYDAMGTTLSAIDAAGGVTNLQTRLLALQEARRVQEAQAVARQAAMQDPSLLLGGGMGQTTLGSLGPSAGGAITQQSFGPSGPGATQTVPPPMDLSQYATGQPPPTLATVGAQPRVDPMEALVRRNPDAAAILMRQQQGIQEWRQKQEIDRLTWGTKIAEFVAQQLQGVTDQASLDAAREQIQRVHPQAASQIPQWYSKAGVDALVRRGLTAKENAEARLNNAKAQTFETAQQMLPGALQALQGVTQPTTGGTTEPSAGAPAGGPPAAPVPQDVEAAITEANRMYPQVRRELIRNVIRAESNFDRQAVSPKGAQGYMQIMPATGKELGLQDPFDARQNILAGTKYLDQLLTRYNGDERKALAAYNAGPGAVDKAGGVPDIAETQAYVTKVQQGGGARPAGTSPAAARTDPQVQRLTQGMERVQQLINAYSVMPGMNEYADNLRQNILEPMRKERDRLEEVPRAVEKQRALQGGELEKASAAERLKQEQEPASREEIDAINRGLAPDKRIPYGTPRSEIRKQGLVGGIPIPEKGNEELIARSTIVNQLGELKTRFGDLPTGPIQGRLNQYREILGVDLKDEQVGYRTLLNTVRNRVINALSGAAVSPDEAKRILAELPDENTSPQAFKGRIEAALKIAEDVYKRRAQFYRRSGHAVPESLMTPYWDEAPPGATGSTSAGATAQPKPTAQSMHDFIEQNRKK